MKKKNIIIICIIIFISLFLFANSFNKIGNYFERGELDKGHLTGDAAGWYRLNIFRELNTIVTSEDFGTFVIQRNGKFLYFPGNSNIFDPNVDNIYKYKGYWYKPRSEIRFTVTQKRIKGPFPILGFRDHEYFCSFGYVDSGNMTFNDNLLINDQEFKVLDTELTEKSERKLRLDDEIIKEFLKQK